MNGTVTTNPDCLQVRDRDGGRRLPPSLNMQINRDALRPIRLTGRFDPIFFNEYVMDGGDEGIRTLETVPRLHP